MATIHEWIENEAVTHEMRGERKTQESVNEAASRRNIVMEAGGDTRSK